MCTPAFSESVGLSGSYTLPPVSDSHISQLSRAADVSFSLYAHTRTQTDTQIHTTTLVLRGICENLREDWLADISIISHMALLKDRTLSIMARTASVYRKLAVIITFHILSWNILFEMSNKTKKNKAVSLTGWKINYFYLVRSEKTSQNIKRIVWSVKQLSQNDNINININK